MLADLAWLLGVLTLALLSPGPDFLLVVKNSVGGARARALATAGGIATGLAVQMLVISLGLAAVPASALQVMQWIGAAVLAGLGARAMLARPMARSASGPAAAASTRSGYCEGFVCNVTNPKALVFFVSLFVQVMPPAATPLWRVLVPVVIVLHGLVMWCAVVFALQSAPVARLLGRAQHWLPRVFGGALVVVAVVMLAEAWR